MFAAVSGGSGGLGTVVAAGFVSEILPSARPLHHLDSRLFLEFWARLGLRPSLNSRLFLELWALPGLRLSLDSILFLEFWGQPGPIPPNSKLFLEFQGRLRKNAPGFKIFS